jgi:hypothetical protein
MKNYPKVVLMFLSDLEHNRMDPKIFNPLGRIASRHYQMTSSPY